MLKSTMSKLFTFFMYMKASSCIHGLFFFSMHICMSFCLPLILHLFYSHVLFWSFVYSSRDFQNDFIFLSILKSKKILCLSRASNWSGDCTFLQLVPLHLNSVRATTLPDLSLCIVAGAPRIFGISLKHDPLFWHIYTWMEKKEEPKIEKCTRASISIYVLHVKYTNILWLSTLNPISFTVRETKTEISFDKAKCMVAILEDSIEIAVQLPMNNTVGDWAKEINKEKQNILSLLYTCKCTYEKKRETILRTHKE